MPVADDYAGFLQPCSRPGQTVPELGACAVLTVSEGALGLAKTKRRCNVRLDLVVACGTTQRAQGGQDWLSKLSLRGQL